MVSKLYHHVINASNLGHQGAPLSDQLREIIHRIPSPDVAYVYHLRVSLAPFGGE